MTHTWRLIDQYGHVLAILCCISSLLFGCTPAGDSPQSDSQVDLESVTLQLKWYHQFQFAGYYAALEQGYYQDAGLDVTIVEGDPVKNLNIYDEVLASNVQYGVSNSDTVLQRLQGEPVVVLASIFQHSPLVLMVRQDSGLIHPQDLIGKTILMTLEPRTAEVQAMLLEEGVGLDKVNYIYPPASGEAVYPDVLFEGSIDAFSVYATNEPFFLEQAGIPISFIRPQTYGIDFYGDVLFTSETELANHPDRVQRFREASLKGWLYAMEHPDEIIDLIHNKYGTSIPREKLEYEAEKMEAFILPQLIEIGHMNPGRWQHIADTYIQLGMAEPGYSLDGFIYDPQASFDHAFVYRLMGAAGVLALLAGAVALGLVVFNLRLKSEVQARTQELTANNQELIREVEVRKQTEESLRVSQARFSAVWEVASDAMALSDPNGTVFEANPAYLNLYGYSIDEVVGQNFAIIFPEEQRDWANEQYKIAFNLPEPPPAYENTIQHRDGTEHTVESRIGFVTEHSVRVAMLSIIRDITDRKRSEEQVRAALDEKATLLRELYHRTKNNMQVIQSMLSLQSAQFDDPDTRDVFKEVGDKIQSMALVHQKLYQSRSLSSVNLDEYIRDLATLLLRSHNITDEQIALDLDLERVSVLIDTAIPCGLVLSELLSNTFKHAFPDGQAGKMRIKLSQPADSVELLVADNGVGFPAGFDFRQSQTLGMRTIVGIVERQLQGEIAFETRCGLSCQLEFRDNLYTARV